MRSEVGYQPPKREILVLCSIELHFGLRIGRYRPSCQLLHQGGVFHRSAVLFTVVCWKAATAVV